MHYSIYAWFTIFSHTNLTKKDIFNTKYYSNDKNYQCFYSNIILSSHKMFGMKVNYSTEPTQN